MGFLQSLLDLQAPVLLVLMIFGPSLLHRILRYLGRSNQPQLPKTPRPPLPRAHKVLLVLSSCYGIYLLLFPPFDIFTTYNLPITTTSDILRRAILRQFTQTPISAVSPFGFQEISSLETLITKLSNLDTRILYARFGHNPLTDCSWCKDLDDYTLASLPSIIQPYILTAGVLGMMGFSWLGGPAASLRAEKWRGGFGWLLVIMALGEVGVKYFWDMRIFQGDCLHLSPMIHTIRTIILLTLPIVYSFLPVTTPPTSQLINILPAIQNTTQTIRLTSLARVAIAKSPVLRSTWSRIGTLQQGDMDTAYYNPEVRKVVRDLGIQEGEIRREAEGWIKDGWDRLIRIEQPDQNSRHG